MVSKYRKKPVVIEARQTGQNNDEDHFIMEWCGGRVPIMDNSPSLFIIETKEGPLYVTPGDWIIKGIAGEFYPHKPDIFAEAYEKVEEE